MGERGEPAIKSIVVEGWIAFTVAGAIKTAREYARIKIDGLRLVGGNPDFTNAPGHGDDDARFYDRQQAYVHARGG